MRPLPSALPHPHTLALALWPAIIPAKTKLSAHFLGAENREKPLWGLKMGQDPLPRMRKWGWGLGSWRCHNLFGRNLKLTFLLLVLFFFPFS